MDRRKTYYIIASDLTIRMKEWKNDDEDKANYHCGNRYRRRADAEERIKEFKERKRGNNE